MGAERPGDAGDEEVETRGAEARVCLSLVRSRREEFGGGLGGFGFLVPKENMRFLRIFL